MEPLPLILDVSVRGVIIGSTMKQRLQAALKALVNTVRIWGHGHDAGAPILLPLTPEYEPEKHQVYFDVIERALADKKHPALNIALTGSYGVGKSSILMEVARRHRRKAISISLASLGFPEDEQLPKQEKAPQARTKTNRIQKEIVKQLLYSEDPAKMRGSRYHRTSGFRFWRALWLAVLLSLPVALVFFLAGWTADIAALIPQATEYEWLPHAATYVGSVALVMALFTAFHNRFQIERLGSGATSITLSPKSPTYFDEYLDEIVYFFEVVKRDIVIFEDIDRFDDAHIFETLRSLNSILNGAKQLKGRRIRFIYAIKDSIFDELGARAAKEESDVDDDAAEAEVARANRTKFFDLVVPVVPFITHRSARDLLVETMGKDLEHEVSDDLIDLAARYVADMRLIKNIRNEYAIFKRLVLDAGEVELDSDKLFAMVLYKSTHLADFEKIKLGKSNIDDLYRDGRQLVAANLKAEDAKLRTARARKQSAQISAAQAKRFGDLLGDHFDRIAGYFDSTTIRAMQYAGTAFQRTDLTTPELWERFATEDGNVTLTVHDSRVGSRIVTVPDSDIERVIGARLSSKDWVASEHDEADAAVEEASARREFLRGADMADLLGEKYVLEVDGAELTFEAIAKKRLTSEFALQLLGNGYIDRNFTLYTSTFYDNRVSANATNYLMKNVDKHLVDMYFELSKEDVEAVLREGGRTILREKAVYNISVLNYLIEKGNPELGVVVGSLMRFDDDERELLLAYLELGEYPDKLVAALAPRWASVFTFVAAASSVDAAARLPLLDAALRAASPQIRYETGPELREALVVGVEEISACTSDDTPAVAAGIYAELLAAMKSKLPSLAGLGVPARRAVVEARCYEVTREDLLLALEDADASLSLDAIKRASDVVYSRVQSDLAAYLRVIDEDTETIADGAAFAEILGDIAEAQHDELVDVIDRASEACAATDLADFASPLWPLLADGERFPLTLANVAQYLDEFGVDDCLGPRLDAVRTIEVGPEADEELRVSVATAILDARENLPSAAARALIVRSLDLDAWFPVADVPEPTGQLIGWLIFHEVIEDDAESFAAIPANDASGRAFAIGKSAKFKDFMTPTEVPPAQVGSIVASADVPNPVKNAIVERFADFTVGTPRAGLQQVARYAADKRRSMGLDDITRLATEGVEASLVLKLLKPHLASIPAAPLAAILQALGKDYALLASRTGKKPLIDNDAAHRALADRVVALENATRWKPDGRKIRVQMRR